MAASSRWPSRLGWMALGGFMVWFLHTLVLVHESTAEVSKSHLLPRSLIKRKESTASSQSVTAKLGAVSPQTTLKLGNGLMTTVEEITQALDAAKSETTATATSHAHSLAAGMETSRRDKDVHASPWDWHAAYADRRVDTIKKAPASKSDTTGAIAEVNRALDPATTSATVTSATPILSRFVKPTGERAKMLNDKKALLVDTMREIWRNYKDHAWGFDELLPVSLKGHNAWGGLGMSMVDALDTLWIMGLKAEFNETADYVEKNLPLENIKEVSVFETTIRLVGGLLSAHALSGREGLLLKAAEVGRGLLPAFDTPTGLPSPLLNFKTGEQKYWGWKRGKAVAVAEAGSVQMEFRYLSWATGDPRFKNAADRAMDAIGEFGSSHRISGMAPQTLDTENHCVLDERASVGAFSDSYYEYLLKMWFHTSGTESRWRERYEASVEGMHKGLFKASRPDVLHARDGSEFEHLSCFLPGVMALSTIACKTDALSSPSSCPSTAARDLESAKKLLKGCTDLYTTSGTGLAADTSSVNGKSVNGKDKSYKLRPETVESLWSMFRATGDEKYRDISLGIFDSIYKHCRVAKDGYEAYGAYRDVDVPGLAPQDKMESFFLAETIKYMFLMLEPDLLPLDRWVMNTEAHPMPVLDERYTKKAKEDDALVIPEKEYVTECRGKKRIPHPIRFTNMAQLAP